MNVGAEEILGHKIRTGGLTTMRNRGNDDQ